MRSLAILLLFLAGPPAAADAQATPPAAPPDDGPVIVLVRHAEKAAEPADDPPLTAAGRERAAILAGLLGRSGVTAVLSSDYRRTRETAAPLAGAAGVEIEIYDPRRPGAVAEALRSRSGVVVVVGHSNTTPALVEALGGDPGEPISDDEYDRLYVVYPDDAGPAATLVLRFGDRYAQGAALPGG